LKYRPAVLVLFAALLAGGAAEAETFPVRWSPSLGLQSLDDIDRRVEQPLWDDIGITVAFRWRFTSAGQALEPIDPEPMISCADHWRLADTVYQTASQSDHNHLANFAATCAALAALRHAQPSRESYVGDFRLDAAAADFLPAALAIAIGPWQQRDIDEAGAHALPWRQWRAGKSSDLISVRSNGDEAVLYEWTRGKSRVEILGRGDFNEDEVEDLLLIITEWPGYAHFAKAKMILVTRYYPDVVMHAFEIN
jgi:hypothetical protein